MAERRKIKTPPASQLLTTLQAAEYIGLTRRSLHRNAQLGRLTKYYIGSRLRWDRAELDALAGRYQPEHLQQTAARLAAAKRSGAA